MISDVGNNMYSIKSKINKEKLQTIKEEKLSNI